MERFADLDAVTLERKRRAMTTRCCSTRQRLVSPYMCLYLPKWRKRSGPCPRVQTESTCILLEWKRLTEDGRVADWQRSYRRLFKLADIRKADALPSAAILRCFATRLP